MNEISIRPLFIILGQAIKYLLHILCTRRFFFVLVYMYVKAYELQSFQQMMFNRGESRRISEGFDFIILPYLLYVFRQTSLSKQCRTRSDAAERGVWSRSTLFATHPANLYMYTFTGNKMDLKRNILNHSSHKKKFWVKVGFDWTPEPPLNPPLFN